MLAETLELVLHAQAYGYAVGAFNIYNLEGALAVRQAAEAQKSPAIIQIHPRALVFGGRGLISLCLGVADEASVPLGVHLDHCDSPEIISFALTAGIRSIMADGSKLPYEGNLAFTREMTHKAHQQGADVEAELGRISGSEDGISQAAWDAKMTDPIQAEEFIRETNVDMFAVCIGNVHGPYPGEPGLDFYRLREIREKVELPLVLHGTSGLPDPLIQKSIQSGICKFNVNTELRRVYISAAQRTLSDPSNGELLDLMEGVVKAMQEVVMGKMVQFKSTHRY